MLDFQDGIVMLSETKPTETRAIYWHRPIMQYAELEIFLSCYHSSSPGFNFLHKRSFSFLQPNSSKTCMYMYGISGLIFNTFCCKIVSKVRMNFDLATLITFVDNK